MTLPITLALALLQATASVPPAPTSTAAAPPAAAAPVDAAASAPANDPTVCRSIDISGSAFPKRECHRLSTWTKLDRQG